MIDPDSCDSDKYPGPKKKTDEKYLFFIEKFDFKISGFSRFPKKKSFFFWILVPLGEPTLSLTTSKTVQ